MFPPALPLRSSGTPCGPIKNPLLQNKQGTTESAAVPPKLSDKHKRVIPKGRKFRGTTLLDQIDSRSCNADHSGRSYSTFSAAVRERTSLFSGFRLAPSAGSLRSTPISTFFRQYYSCIVYILAISEKLVKKNFNIKRAMKTESSHSSFISLFFPFRYFHSVDLAVERRHEEKPDGGGKKKPADKGDGKRPPEGVRNERHEAKDVGHRGKHDRT